MIHPIPSLVPFSNKHKINAAHLTNECCYNDLSAYDKANVLPSPNMYPFTHNTPPGRPRRVRSPFNHSHQPFHLPRAHRATPRSRKAPKVNGIPARDVVQGRRWSAELTGKRTGQVWCIGTRGLAGKTRMLKSCGRIGTCTKPRINVKPLGLMRRLISHDDIFHSLTLSASGPGSAGTCESSSATGSRPCKRCLTMSIPVLLLVYVIHVVIDFRIPFLLVG
ncbi:hypothetical protein QBC32DRAFT_151378 [Pseudoneurospora amorphoporcata]|uniref:Uncharacterized protein n=1 Tax=Pseudoneurospora amorphoporcata TaxID=241081 RepID=A0AAN6NKL2_9PEZI|nr:hypothetical protein QBC32DRAFT_151378 [Pseudoneurospora amorphoporcata]